MESKEKAEKFDRRKLLENAPRCKRCGISLLTPAEAKIGVHIRCVFESNNQKQKATIPRPRYGRHGI